MNRNDSFQCDNCRVKFSTIADLAIHQAEHLVISIPFTQICPICNAENTNLEDLLHHVLQHLMEDQLEQAKLIKWMSLQNYEPDHFVSRLLETPDFKTYKEFKIMLPMIKLRNKCVFCCKFFSPDSKVTKKVLEHIFSHVISSDQAIQRTALWAEKFFMLEESKSIVKTFHDFILNTKILDRSSHLLEELNLFENQATNTCRYCQMKFSDASTLYSHYVEWHSEQPSKYYNCSVCNFKESNEIMFLDHIYKRHIGCACGEKFQRFEKCLKHVRGCLKNCPHCKNKFDFKGLISHLNQGAEVDVCPFCKEKTTSNQLKVHLSNCSSRTTIGVQCPTCKKSAFVEKEKLDDHLISECKPWITNSSEEVPCLNGSRKKNQIPEENNLVKLDDIQIFLPNNLDTIEDYLS